MSGLEVAGKTLMVLGGLAVVCGALLWGLSRLTGGSGRLLPGDIVIQRPGLTFVFPIVTSLVLSVILTFVLWLLHAWRR